MFTYWIEFVNKEIGDWVNPTRKFLTIDGYTTLEVDYFTPLSAKIVDLDDETAEFNFIPPAFKDNAGNKDI